MYTKKTSTFIFISFICFMYCMQAEMPVPIAPADLSAEIVREKEIKRSEFLKNIEKARKSGASFVGDLERDWRSELAIDRLSAFDGKVGDSLCEVRACMVADGLLSGERDLALALFLLKRYNWLEYDSNGMVAKDDMNFQRANGSVFAQWPGSGNACRDLQNASQRFVAACSCDYLRFISERLGDVQLQRAFTCLFRDRNARLTPAFYPAVKAVVIQALCSGCPIVVKIRRFCDLCSGCHEGTFFYVPDLMNPDLTTRAFIPQERIRTGTPVLVYECNSFPQELVDPETGRFWGIGFGRPKPIAGCSDAQEFFSTFVSRVQVMGGLKTLILADAAQHKQWGFCSAPDAVQRAWLCDMLFKNGQEDLAIEIGRMNAIAHEFGCSRQNPTFVLIEHIYADVIKE